MRTSNVTIYNVTVSDAGNYTCVAESEEGVVNSTKFLDLSFEGKLLNKTQGPVHLNVSNTALLYCVFEGKLKS